MDKMMIKKMTVGMMATNCYLLINEKLSEAVCIDPGGSPLELLEAIEANKCKLVAILLTHGHFDHILGVAELRAKTGVKVFCSIDEVPLLDDARMNCSEQVRKPVQILADETLSDGQMIELAGIEIKALLTPGHTRGSMCFYIKQMEEDILFSGDSLFCETIGRTDLPTGNSHLLPQIIREKLYVLPEDTIVYPGHGDITTIGYEKNNNPYTRESGQDYV